MQCQQHIGSTLDEILDMGDSQFLNALQRGFIPDAPTLSVEQLPTTVHFARSNEDNNSGLPFEAQNEISKPIVKLPHVATKAKANPNPGLRRAQQVNMKIVMERLRNS